jgi:hypothetical protein
VVTCSLVTVGCDASGGGPDGNGLGRGQALVVTTDYQTGSYATVDMEDRGVVADIEVIHPDAVCRYDPITATMYMISRLGADAVEVLDPENGWRVTYEYSVGPGSNPQDLAVVSVERAYVLRYGDARLAVVHPLTGAWLGEVDLSDWADSDGVPEAAWAVVHADWVYVAIQRLTGFLPSEYSSVLVLDAASGEVEREVRLTGTNPFARMRYSPALDRIVVSEAGRFGELDGGLELIDPADHSLSGFVLREQDLGGDIVDAVIVDDTKGYAVLAVTQPGHGRITSVIRFDPGTGEKTGVLAEADGFDYSFLELSPDASQLWITDRTRTAPGVRIFDTGDDTEITSVPISTGLPPFMICFVDKD